MKTIKTYNLLGCLLLAGTILAGCSKATDSLKPQTVQKLEGEKAAEESQTTETPEGPNAFILKIEAENVATKALTDMGQTLGSEWRQGDSLSVYNQTTKENIEGWLYAEADGTSTTFSGTVAGNFNQGDILLLQFLAPDYQEQDGTLEGLAAQCDYATSRVEVTAIDPEAKTIATEHASFEKMQAVVKFDITNRKNPVEPVKVTSFFGYGVLPGSETPFGIQVTPAAATDELYVGIPYFENMKITFEAEGEDGFEYRLIVPEVSFEEGLYYRRQLNMKRKALVKAPVAKANLTYNNAPQNLVESAHVYWMVNGQEVILDNDKDYQQDSCVISYFVKKEETAGTVPTAPIAAENGWMTSIPTQTHAGTYYVWTKMMGNYDYEDADVSSEPVKVVIAKATPTISAAAVSSEMSYNAQSQNLLSGAAALKIGNTVVTTAKDAASTACTIKYYVTTENLSQAPAATASGWGTSYAAVHSGTHYVWIMTAGNGDMNAATAKVSKQIKKATATVNDVSANPSFLVYNGSSQSLLSGAATLKIGSTNVTSATDAQLKACSIQYYVSTSQTSATGGSWGTSYSAKNAGTYYVWVKVTGNGDINNITEAYKVSKVIAKATPTVTPPTAKSLTFNGNNNNKNGSAQTLINAGSTTGGTIQYKVGNGSYGTNLPTATNADTYTVYYKVVGNDNYNGIDAASLTVTIAKANGWLSLDKPDSSMNEGDVRYIYINNSHGGDITYSKSGETSYYDVEYQQAYNRIRVKRKKNDDYKRMDITITCGATTNYNSASDSHHFQ